MTGFAAWIEDGGNEMEVDPMSRFRNSTLPLLLLTIAGPANAVDGVLEINQTCAVETGCFSGDAAGFPITIDGTAGGAYRLTPSWCREI